MKKKTGGFAFSSVTETHSERGMSLIDFFAVKAMQGELSAQRQGRDITDFRALARRSYEVAEAMVEAREDESTLPPV